MSNFNYSDSRLPSGLIAALSSHTELVKTPGVTQKAARLADPLYAANRQLFEKPLIDDEEWASRS